MTYSQLIARLDEIENLPRKRERKAALRQLLLAIGACKAGIEEVVSFGSLRTAFQNTSHNGQMDWWLQRVWSMRSAEDPTFDLGLYRRVMSTITRTAYHVWAKRVIASNQRVYEWRLSEAIRASFTYRGDLR